MELLPTLPIRVGWLPALGWPALGCLSYVCCLTVTGRFQLHDRGAPGVESPLSHGSPGRDRALPRERVRGWMLRGHCSCLAGEPCAFSTGLFSCPSGSCRFIACRLPLSSLPSAWGFRVPTTSGLRSILGPGALGGRGDPRTAIPQVCFHVDTTLVPPSAGTGSQVGGGPTSDLQCPEPPSDPMKVPSVG